MATAIEEKIYEIETGLLDEEFTDDERVMVALAVYTYFLGRQERGEEGE